MKKNFIKIGIAAMIVAGAAVNVHLNNSNKNEAGDVALSEVEALAQYELPEVTVTCNATAHGWSQCWKPRDWNLYNCYFTGSPIDFCIAPF